MDDFLDAPAADFDWGPRSRICTAMLAHTILIATGAALMILGVLLA